MLPNISSSSRVHHGDVADELLIDVVEFTNVRERRVDEGDVLRNVER